MVLGAGRDQVPVIQKAQQMGFEAIVVSIDGDYPGFLIADKSYKIDVKNKDAVLGLAKSEGICGIVSDQLDIAVPTVAYVAEQMGLQGIGYDCALKFTNKYKMLQGCKEIGIPVLRHFHTATMDQAIHHSKKIDFPMVIKPVDNTGSRGVSKVNNFGELESKFKKALSHSASGYVILEELLLGKEYAVVGFVSNYKYRNLGIGERYYFTIPDLFIPKRTLFPCLLSQYLKNKIIGIDARL